MAKAVKHEPKVVPLAGALVAVAIAAGIGFVVGKVVGGPASARRSAGPSGPVRATTVADADWQKLLSAGKPVVEGPESAPVTVVSFSDYKCGYCQKVHAELARLADRHRGKVRVVFREYPLPSHEGAHLAAQAAVAAAAQGKHRQYHERLFANMGRTSRSDLDEFARQVGLDLGAFGRALDEETYRAQVDADVALGSAIGVQGTPTLVINREMVVGPNPAQLGQMIDRALQGKSVADAPARRGEPESAGAGRGEGDGRSAGRGEQAARQPQAPRPPPPLPAETASVGVEPWNPSRGPANAPVTLVLFCEYLCPFCKRIQPTLEMIQARYGDRVRIVFRNNIVHQPAEESSRAALASMAQGMGAYERFHAAMFADQGRARTREGVLEIAGQAGLDVARLTADMDSPEIRQRLEADKAAAAAAGARGTPATFLNGRLMSGAVPPSHFGAWIDQLLGIPGPTIPASDDPNTQAPSGGCG
jgi:protein-disulfide isomerase